MSTSDIARGLYNKFFVSRIDHSDVEGGKHHKCKYFVLDITHDPFAISAIETYAIECRNTHPRLSEDLMDMVEKARGKDD